jgi:hypothetical protein
MSVCDGNYSRGDELTKEQCNNYFNPRNATLFKKNQELSGAAALSVSPPTLAGDG